MTQSHFSMTTAAADPNTSPPPTDEWGPPKPTHPPPSSLSYTHSSSLALTSRTSVQNNIKWVPVVWYSNISLILFTVFSEHYGDRSLSRHSFFVTRKKIKLNVKKKSIKMHYKNFCSRLNNVHGGLVVFHTSRVLFVAHYVADSSKIWPKGFFLSFFYWLVCL